jgi:hypothetical protein
LWVVPKATYYGSVNLAGQLRPNIESLEKQLDVHYVGGR